MGSFVSPSIVTRDDRQHIDVALSPSGEMYPELEADESRFSKDRNGMPSMTKSRTCDADPPKKRSLMDVPTNAELKTVEKRIGDTRSSCNLTVHILHRWLPMARYK